jgi:hypothetical protein
VSCGIKVNVNEDLWGSGLCGFADLRICGFADLRICGFADLRMFNRQLFKQPICVVCHTVFLIATFVATFVAPFIANFIATLIVMLAACESTPILSPLSLTMRTDQLSTDNCQLPTAKNAPLK